jgi:prepilin-type N-terminal cleavage/methylation domain-containing protein
MTLTRGFTLLELSIVLVIIGLIAGGIVAGSAMIRAAELRAIITDLDRYKTAVHTFKDKYLGLPGDLKNATAFWGDNATLCADAAITNGTPGTCNGDGDGTNESSGAAGSTDERFQFWNHLSLAELINGTFSGASGAGGASHAVIGENVPESKISGVGWTQITWLGGTFGHISAFDGYYYNTFILGAATTTAETLSPFLTPQEAWNLDTKMDDGKPALGNLLPRSRANCTNATAAVADSDNFDAEYNLSSDERYCSLIFRKVF